MSEVFPARILELMASKICHDLISPIGAVSNGIEFLEDMEEDVDEEAIKLISFSATQASSKLKAFRIAYGAGGSDPNIKLEDIHKIFADYIAGDKRITQDWDYNQPLGVNDPPKGFCKLLLCCLLLLCDTLPKGGSISVSGDDGDNSVKITSRGTDTAFREGYYEALTGDVSPDDLEPKTIHPYITKLLLQHYGYSIHVCESPDDSIILSLSYGVVS